MAALNREREFFVKKKDVYMRIFYFTPNDYLCELLTFYLVSYGDHKSI